MSQARSTRPSAGKGAAFVGAVFAAAVLGPVPAGADTGDALREGVRNGTTTRETEIIGRFNQSTGAKGGYVTRQSNTQTGANAGGAAVYGCRGAQNGSAAGSAPCLRASNLANGFSFEFATRGILGAGLFVVPTPAESGPVMPTAATLPAVNPSIPPFQTNAGGEVKNLRAEFATNATNATTVGGRTAASLVIACPAGTQLLTGSCIETAARAAADFFDASEQCGDSNRRLPTASELRSARRQLDLPGFEVTSDVFHDGTGFRYMAVNDAGTLTVQPTPNPNAFRCVAPLTN